MKMSKTGLILCGVYCAFTAVVILITFLLFTFFLAGADKSQFALLHIPVGLTVYFGIVAVYSLGLEEVFGRLPDVVGYFVLFLPTLAAIYSFGWAFDWLFRNAPPKWLTKAEPFALTGAAVGLAYPLTGWLLFLWSVLWPCEHCTPSFWGDFFSAMLLGILTAFFVVVGFYIGKVVRLWRRGYA